MSKYVCKGAKLKCSMGDSQSELNVLPEKAFFWEGKEMANIMDNKPMVNIQPFGQCQSLANPTVAMATAANFGVLQPLPCIPNTTAPWMQGHLSFTIKGQPALMDDCKLMCAYAGVIEITDAGQTTVQTGAERVEERVKDKIINSKCIVEFRPEDSWTGEFGFDWFRKGDHQENVNGMNELSRYDKKDTINPIVGKYTPNDPDYGTNALRSFVTDVDDKEQYYVKILERKEYNPLFFVHKIPKKYHIPCLSLFSKEDYDATNEKFLESKTEAKLKLIIESENIEKIVLKSPDTNLLEVVPTELTDINDGKSEDKTITIKCLKKFSENKIIQAYSIEKETLKERLVGQLKVFKNNYKEVDIVFVNVITDLNGGEIEGITSTSFADDQSKLLKKFLSQALVVCRNIEQYPLDLADATIRHTFNNDYSIQVNRSVSSYYGRIINRFSNSGGVQLVEHLESLMPAEYQNYYKVFFFGEIGGRRNVAIDRSVPHDTNTGQSISFLGGHAKDIPSKALVMYKNPALSTVSHEIMHCFGLYHSFSNEGKHTFLKEQTSNIMDYSKDTSSTWRWQWEKIHEKIY